MSKNKILIVFEVLERGRWYFEDYLLPIIGEAKRLNNYAYETDNAIIQIANGDKLRGLRADLVFVENGINFNMFDEIIMPIVKYDRNKINVVL